MLFGAPRSCMFKSLQGSPEGLKGFMPMDINSMVAPHFPQHYKPAMVPWYHNCLSGCIEPRRVFQQSSNQWYMNRFQTVHKYYCYDPKVCQGQRCTDISLRDPPYQSGPPQIKRGLPHRDQVWRSSHVTREGLPTSFWTFECFSLIITPSTPTLGFKASANNLALHYKPHRIS